jgi:hypothetical protein
MFFMPGISNRFINFAHFYNQVLLWNGALEPVWLNNLYDYDKNSNWLEHFAKLIIPFEIANVNISV